MPQSLLGSADSSIVERLLQAPQYALGRVEKSALLLKELCALTTAHRESSPMYRQILDGAVSGGADAESLCDLPFLPVRLFKTLKLQSVPDSSVLRVLTSSGTTSQQVSRIAVDRETALFQTRALGTIVSAFIGPKRLPMVVIDTSALLRKRDSMSARGAGLVGLSNFGRDHFYALDEHMQLDVQGLKTYVERYAGQPILIFGFTFMVWQYFYQELRRLGERLALGEAILIHSGGWKKLEDKAVTNDVFKSSLREQCGIRRIHNFYGMVEQTGSIYMECEDGYFHAPDMADVLIRDPRTWGLAPFGEPGLIQTMSILPRSYPGHSLLTEDLGIVHGVDDCSCGRRGVRFRVLGRAPRSELRGCSDTHAAGELAATVAGEIQQFLPEAAHRQDIASVVTSEFLRQRPMMPLDPLVFEFLDRVSAEIFRLPISKQFPELSALAFWLRRSNLQTMAGQFREALRPHEVIRPLGVVSHVAPSNVDTIFLYSWALAMLAGNLNVVRISQNVSVPVSALLDVLSRTMADPRWDPIRRRSVLLTYPHDDGVSRFISEQSDARLIWGGDETVRYFRSFAAKPTTRDICFADKLSACVINAERYLDLSEAARTEAARAFFNDAYQFDQMACSSPHFVFIAGPERDRPRASAAFWSALSRETSRLAQAESWANAVDKLVAAYQALGRVSGVEWVSRGIGQTPVVIRVPVEAVGVVRLRVGGGFFVESFVEDVGAVAQAIEQADQTLTYIGFTREEMLDAAPLLSVRGIDRIVPVGQALTFGPVWDGYVLFGELTRRVVVG